MNDRSPFERLVADRIAEEPRSIPLPGTFTDELSAQAGRSGQRPRWLALLKEPPMRTESHLAVGSPTVRVVALMAATLLLAAGLVAAGIAGQRLIAAEGIIVVAQDGNGTYATITEAVAAAQDGDEIRIEPGNYVENVAVVGKDLTISGEGDREEIVIEVDDDGPVADFDWASYMGVDPNEPPAPRAMILADTRTELSNLTFLAGPESEAISIVGADTDVTITGIVVRALGDVRGSTNAVFWEAGASGALRDSHIEGWIGLNGAAVCLGVWGQGADVVVRRNIVHGCEFEKGIEIEGGNTALVEGNDIWVENVEPGPSNPLWGGRTGIKIQGSTEGSVTIRDNDIHDSLVGIDVFGPSAVEISDNRIRDNETGIAEANDSTTISGNAITGSYGVGLQLLRSSPTVEDNEVSGNTIGLSLGQGATPTLSGNTICDNGTNVRLVPDGDLPDLAGNEICADS